MVGSPKRSIGRPPRKKGAVVKELRTLIVSGRYPPQSRVPTLRELSRQFRVSPVTVQQAFVELARDGFIESRGSMGTFVVDHPPHASQLALLFPEPVSVGPRVRFWTALANSAVEVDRDPSTDVRIRLHHQVKAGPGNEDYLALVRDIRAHRLAGLIFPCRPFMYVGTPLLDDPNVCRIVIDGSGDELSPGAAHVRLDGVSFMDRAVSLLASRKRSRVALLAVPGMASRWFDAFLSRLRDHGMVSRPYWIQCPALDHPETARAITHAVMHADQHVRPDALLIADDNFVEHATLGLADAGMRVPAEADVIAHCNYPWPTPSVVPVTRLGFDAREVLSACVAAFEGLRDGRRPPEFRIPARFEQEVRGPSAALAAGEPPSDADNVHPWTPEPDQKGGVS